MKRKFWFYACAFVLVFSLLCGCGAPDKGASGGWDMWDAAWGALVPDGSGDDFNEIKEKDFTVAATQPDSAFSLSVSSSAYTYMRRSLGENKLPQADSVRIEEYINYFDYGVAPPEEGEDFAALGRVFDCPWNQNNKLLRVSYRARDIERDDVRNNIVILADTSGSMHGADRLGLLQTAVAYLMQGLTQNDKVSLVSYAGSNRIIFEGKTGADKADILDAVNTMQASGATAGYGALERAYGVARRHYVQGGNNRVVLFTDGDFNVGPSGKDDLQELVTKERDSGIYLSCVGVGYGNYRDGNMETLANNGNGEAYYLDGESEAKRVFGEKLTGTLITVACDAKAQVVFDATQVEKYRLIGYDNRMLSGAQFEDESTDAGEIGSSHQVTALYEISLTQTCDPLRAAASAELRYRTPGEQGEDRAMHTAVLFEQETGDDTFIACVAELGLLLRQSAYAPGASYASVLRRLDAMDVSADAYKTEFRALARKAARLAANAGQQ